MTIDDDGTPLYNTRLHHGDALHVGDHVTDRPGLEVFSAFDETPRERRHHRVDARRRDRRGALVDSGHEDTGRGAAADIDPNHPGAEAWNIGGDYAWNSPVGTLNAASGEVLSTDIPAANFVTWWDGDLLARSPTTTTPRRHASGVADDHEVEPGDQDTDGRSAARSTAR